MAGAASTAVGMPRKRFYRQRAHANPLSIHHLDVYVQHFIPPLLPWLTLPSCRPTCPATMDWSTHYPTFFEAPSAEGEGSGAGKGKRVEFADVGCGFGGLIMSLAPQFPETLMLGT
jgi:tRNA (guanine-N7-)-methyltransferase